MEYNVEYFINKFEPIPESYWCACGTIGDRSKINIESTCALGFCGGYIEFSYESRCLAKVISEYYYLIGKEPFYNLDLVVYHINDTHNIINLPTPKERILHALYTIRDKELSEANLKEASKIVSEATKLVNEVVEDI